MGQCNSVCQLKESLILSGIFIAPYVVSTIGPQLLEETTGFHIINKHLALILGPVILFAIASSLGSNNSLMFAFYLPLFVIPLFILLVKTVNEHFLGNSSWIYAIAIPIVVYYVSYFIAKQIDEGKLKEEDKISSLRKLALIYLVGVTVLHFYIYFALGKNYKLLN